MNYFVWMKHAVSGKGYPTLCVEMPTKETTPETMKCVYRHGDGYAIHKLSEEDKHAIKTGVVAWHKYLPEKYPLPVDAPDPAFPVLKIETQREIIVTDVIETVDGAVYAR